MDDKQLTLQIIDRINQAFPEQKKAISFLMDQLSITYEAAYRRIRAKIPFRLDEAVIIAKSMNCVLDTMLGTKVIWPELNTKEDNIQFYTSMLRQDLIYLKRIHSAENVEINLTANRIPFRYFSFPTLFQLEYFHYLHQHRHIHVDQTLSDTLIPEEIQLLHKECAYYAQRLKNVTCCINDSTLHSTIQYITYYRQMHKISNKDLSNLLDELADICEQMQFHLHGRDKKFLVNGIFYYTQLPISANFVSVKYDDNFFILLCLYDSIPMIYENDASMFDLYQKWFYGQIFTSQLVSGTNSLMQNRLLLKMQEYRKTLWELTF